MNWLHRAAVTLEVTHAPAQSAFMLRFVSLPH